MLLQSVGYAARDDEAEVGASLDALGEVELGLGALEAQRRFVVGDGGVLSRVKGAEPHTSRFLGVPDLRRPLSPWPLPHPSVVPLPPLFLSDGRGSRRIVLMLLFS